MPLQMRSHSVRPRAVLQSNPLVCLAKGPTSFGIRIAEHSKAETIFCQATEADSVFYLLEGTVVLKVVSNWGKEAIVAILGAGDFFGEGCLTGQPSRNSTAVTLTGCSIMRIEKLTAIRLVRDLPAVSELFLQYLLSRNGRMEEALVDQYFNTSERRLARLLLQLAKLDRDDGPEAVIPKLSQETLAEIVGTTRSRVSLFMNKFRRLGLVDYVDGTNALTVRSFLLNTVLNEGPAPTASLLGARPGARNEEFYSVGQGSMRQAKASGVGAAAPL